MSDGAISLAGAAALPARRLEQWLPHLARPLDSQRGASRGGGRFVQVQSSEQASGLDLAKRAGNGMGGAEKWDKWRLTLPLGRLLCILRRVT